MGLGNWKPERHDTLGRGTLGTQDLRHGPRGEVTQEHVNPGILGYITWEHGIHGQDYAISNRVL